MPGKRDRPQRPKHDASYKSLFAIKRTVADTLRGALGDLAPGLDFSTLQRLPASFVTERIEAVADAVMDCETREEVIARAREAAGTP